MIILNGLSRFLLAMVLLMRGENKITAKSSCSNDQVEPSLIV